MYVVQKYGKIVIRQINTLFLLL